MYKGHLNSTAFIKAGLVQLVEHQTSNLRVPVVGSSPTVSNILHFVAFDKLLAG